MTTPRTTASALAPPARGKTFTTEAERRRTQSQERLEPSTHRARAPQGRPLETKARLVPVTEYGVITAAPGPRMQAALARQAKQVLAQAAPATRQPRPSRPG
jgi:hypothetical protein